MIKLHKKNIYTIKNDDGSHQLYVFYGEGINMGNWVGVFIADKLMNVIKITDDIQLKASQKHNSHVKKIVRSTDYKLIEDGVEALEPEFLDWLNTYKLEYVEILNMTDLCGDCHQNSVYCGCNTPAWCKETYRLFYDKPKQPQPPVEQTYSQKEVETLLIDCKNRFCGGDLEDYHSDSEVIEWFKKFSKNK